MEPDALMFEVHKLLQALWNIAHDSSDVEDVRIALNVLSSTAVGREWLEKHPLNS